jgi:hypothetical protein
MKRLITLPILTLCVLMLALMLTGCNGQQDALRAAPETSVIGTYDGCEVSFVNRGYQELSFYMAKCPGNSTSTTRNYTVKSGKHTEFKRSTVIFHEIEALQVEKAAAEVKEKALEKLTSAELKALGLQ